MASADSDVALAFTVRTPAANALSVTVNVTVAPTPMEDWWHDTTPFKSEHVPLGTVALTKVVPDGYELVITTESATAGP